ncbi:unnamed protein product [Rangifer tarandus platyrhynchus]|uniref:RanBP2-type domain-containing protein n=1 Tax=Rangifer tarandus platyrhynchus TaxID=3082113 RepID=A0ABN9A5R2_RANTA|nr:unnamed protein product [Rangifer tarandus platyrhynchus]
MAVNLNDPACGFHQKEVVDFLNEQIIKNGVSPCFYVMHKSKSWGDMEMTLRDILNNPEISGGIKEACAWTILALAVRFAERQKREDAEKIKELQDQLEEQKLLTDALLGTVRRLREKQEKEKEKDRSRRQQSLEVLRGVPEERNLLRREHRVGTRKQARTEGENQKGTSGTLSRPHSPSSQSKSGESRKGSGRRITAAPGTSARAGEAKDKEVSQPWNDKEVTILSRSQVSGSRAKAGKLPAVDLSQSSCSSLATLSPPGAAAEAAACSSVKDSKRNYRGKHHPTRKFLPERFKQYPGLSYSARFSIRRRIGDWDCAQCHLMNFSWRNICFKCKNSRHTKEGRGSVPIRALTEF